MAVGFPGHTSASVGSIQPPLSIPQASPQHSPQSPARSKLARGGGSGQRKNKKGKVKSKDMESHCSSGEDLGSHSSDSESASTGDLLHWSNHCHRSDNNGQMRNRRSRGHGGTQGKWGVSSSESDVSDSDTSRLKVMWCKIRLQAHSSLARVFQVRNH